MGWSAVQKPGLGITGFPWEGSEIHDRYVDDNGDKYIYNSADVTGYEQDSIDGIKYVCPRYYKTVDNVIYNCQDRSTFWGRHVKRIVEVRQHEFYRTKLRIPGDSSSAARLVNNQKMTRWFPCIELE